MQYCNRDSAWNYLSLISQNGFYAIENQWILLLDTNCHSSNKMVHLKCEHMHFNDNFKWLAMQQWCIFYVRKTRVLIFCHNFIFSSVCKINGSTVFVNQNFCIWRSIWVCVKNTFYQIRQLRFKKNTISRQLITFSLSQPPKKKVRLSSSANVKDLLLSCVTLRIISPQISLAPNMITHIEFNKRMTER